MNVSLIDSKAKIWIIILLMIVFPLVLMFLPKTFFDNGPPLCLITLITGHNCPGCGMTRACMRLIHLDFLGAWQFNKMSILVFPYLGYEYSKYFLKMVRKLRDSD